MNFEESVQPTVIDGRFQLLSKLGGGGMGLVWRAYDLALQREVALKEVRSDDSTRPDDTEAARQRERVLREARALARLQHPNVVTIFHVVDTPELRHPWLVMELVTGGSLEDLLRRGPQPPAEMARIGRGVLAALDAANRAGIQHRDVKPGNVLLRPDGTPVLTDFGIAALQGSTQLTATGSIIGSPEYIAPERLRGVEGDPASDLWSLGIMLYLAVEGHNPMRRPTTVATLTAVLEAPIPPPVHAGPLTPVLGGLLHRDPAARLRAPEADRMLAEIAAPTGSFGAPIWDAIPTPPPFPAPRRSSGNATRFGIAVGLTAAAGLIGAVLWATHSATSSANTASGDSTPTASQTSSPTASVAASAAAVTNSTTSASSGGSGSLLTPAGINAMVKALPSLVGTTKVYELDLYPDYANFEIASKSQPGGYDDVTYQNGVITSDSAGGDLDDGELSVDLKTINWDPIPGLVKQSNEDLDVTNPTDHYVIVDPNWAFGTGTSILVYCANAYGGGYLAADVHGHVFKTYPAGS
ncbi:MAG TPA: serine/threonine-protein kinase [Actinospica sp.]|nr:serine/threonine-protein kinase [Actinospica sp.]